MATKLKFHIETERLLLRDLLPSDAPGMFELDADPLVHRFLGNKPVSTMQESMDMISFIRKQYQELGIGRWAMIEKASGAFMGWTGLKLVTHTINGQTNYYDLGYRMIPRFWGKGYATESALASVTYGVEELKADAIYGMADVKNTASIHVLEKAGLKKLGTFLYEGTEHCWMKMCCRAVGG